MAMSDTSNEQPEVNVEVEGDAVINTAPDGGGVDNEAAPAEADDDNEEDDDDA